MIRPTDNHREDLGLTEILLALRLVSVCMVLSFSSNLADSPRSALTLTCVLSYSLSAMAKLKPKAESQSDEAEGPDGGWGWVLVGALFVTNSLVFGLMRSLGIFFVEFVQYFEESAQAVSWISSIGLAALQFFSESLMHAKV